MNMNKHFTKGSILMAFKPMKKCVIAFVIKELQM